MNLKELSKFVTKHLDDNKAENIAQLDVTSLSGSFDAMIIASGTSTRHVQSIAKKLLASAKESSVKPLGVEGESYGEWVLIDLGDLVVHIMLKAQRDLYQLEKLWTVSETLKKKSKSATKPKKSTRSTKPAKSAK